MSGSTAGHAARPLPNARVFPPTPPPESEPLLPANTSSRPADSASLAPLSKQDLHYLRADFSRRKEILCPYFLKNPHLIPEHSPCRQKSYSNVEALRVHIEFDHDFRLRPQLPTSTDEFEKFQDVWMQIFRDHQGDIPHPYLCDREFLRKQQNFRVVEIHEAYIKMELRDQPAVVEILDRIFGRFRKAFGPSNYGFLPDTVPSMPNSNGATPRNYTTSEESVQRATHYSRAELEEIEDSGRKPHDQSSHISHQHSSDQPLAPHPLKAYLCSLQKTIVDHVMKDFWDLADKERWESEENSDECSSDEYNLMSTSEDDDQDEPIDGDGQHSQSSSGSRPRIGVQPGNSSSTGDRSGQERADQPGSNDSNGGGDGGGRKRKRPLSPASSENDSPPKKLSCPYFKRYPQRPKNRSCCNPQGFSDVSRIKEHIYRVHGPVTQCPRCHGEFTNHEALVAHLAGEERCENQAEEQHDLQSITTEKEKLLKSKKHMRGSSQEERWRRVYRILFDLDDSDATPSPYLEESTLYFERYKRFCRERLPQLVRSELEREGIEHLRNRLVSITQRCQESLFSLFQEAEESGSLDNFDYGETRGMVQDADAAELQPEYLDWSAFLDLQVPSLNPVLGNNLF